MDPYSAMSNIKCTIEKLIDNNNTPWALQLRLVLEPWDLWRFMKAGPSIKTVIATDLDEVITKKKNEYTLNNNDLQGY